MSLLLLHICGGAAGLAFGTAAIFFRKGTRGHRLAGNAFLVAMLTMGATAAYLGNVVGGLLACYLVTTAWLTARRRKGELRFFAWGGFLFALATGSLLTIHGARLVTKAVAPTPGVPTGMIFLLAFVALASAAGDLRLLVRGISGRQRIVRHLWRMCFSFFIATGSFFLGQQQVFPRAWRGSAVWFIPALMPLAAMSYWLIRIRLTNAPRWKSIFSNGDVESFNRY